MLVLSRNRDEVIIIEGRDGPIRIKIVEAYCKVKIGIEAPRSVEVHREEIYEAIKREGKRRT